MRAINDPADHHRTTQAYAGVAFKARLAIPALVLVAAGVVAIVGSLAALGYMRPHYALLFGLVAFVIGFGCLALALVERARIKKIDRQWHTEHRAPRH